MPPALHPRSGFTTSLFTTTLAVSFLVVGLPHILPCPVDPKQYAEGQMEIMDQDGRRRMVRRLPKRRPEGDTAGSVGARTISDGSAEVEDGSGRRSRECPVPKPGGLVGQVLGFRNDAAVRPVVRIEPVRWDRKDIPKEGG